MWIDNAYENLKIGLMFLILVLFSQTLRTVLMSTTSSKIGLKKKKKQYSKCKFWFDEGIWGIYVAGSLHRKFHGGRNLIDYNCLVHVMTVKRYPVWFGFDKSLHSDTSLNTLSSHTESCAFTWGRQLWQWHPKKCKTSDFSDTSVSVP